MLSRAGLGDDAGLAHLLRQQRLTDDLVRLVGAAVDEVLAFEEDARVGAIKRQVPALGERRGAAEVIAQEAAVLGHELLVLEGVDKRALQLVEGGQQRLRDELPAKFSVVGGQDGAAAVGVVTHCSSLGSGSCQ